MCTLDSVLGILEYQAFAVFKYKARRSGQEFGSRQGLFFLMTMIER